MIFYPNNFRIKFLLLDHCAQAKVPQPGGTIPRHAINSASMRSKRSLQSTNSKKYPPEAGYLGGKSIFIKRNFYERDFYNFCKKYSYSEHTSSEIIDSVQSPEPNRQGNFFSFQKRKTFLCPSLFYFI